MPDRQPPKPSARATGRTSFAKHELEQAKPRQVQDRTAFSAAELVQGRPPPDEPLRDQDNAQMRPKPKGISLDHTRMAPPGMSGIKTGGQAGGLSRSTVQPADRPVISKKPSDLVREFKGLTSQYKNERCIDR